MRWAHPTGTIGAHISPYSADIGRYMRGANLGPVTAL
jgi:hypothetical protein